MIPNLNEVCDCCGGYENQPVLQIFSDNCFRVVEGKDTHGEFCIGNFAFPVDGYSCLALNAEVSGGEITVFDNAVNVLSPSEVLESGKLYARGVMIRIVYPTYNTDGDSLATIDKSVRISIETADTLTTSEYPLYDFFTIFTNPKSNKVEDLINKIKIINTNELYAVRVSGLVLFGKAV